MRCYLPLNIDIGSNIELPKYIVDNKKGRYLSITP